LTVADIRAGLIADTGAPVTGTDASTAVVMIEPRIHFKFFSSGRNTTYPAYGLVFAFLQADLADAAAC
jgi:hypothetical protein